MRRETAAGIPVESEVLGHYLETLVDRFFKILPLRESGEPSLGAYLESLRSELAGFEAFMVDLRGDGMLMSLLCMLQYLIDHPETEVRQVRREVFRAISLCNKLSERYRGSGGVKT